MATARLNSTQVMPIIDGTRPPSEILLGRYRVLARCGTGGFGTVCVCWDTRLQRRVAIKRMPIAAGPSGSVLASTVDEALAEARTACLLAHRNIVTVFDFEVEDDYAYLVMEYVDGLNLSELLQRVEGGVLTHAEAAHVLESVTEALSYAHENGALHLDIKPTNIMIDRNGTVKLADFGMATLASAAGYGDARGGTVGYMPPEQIRGELVDERADVFSLAVVMWQAITGTNPFASTTAKNSLDRIGRGPRQAIAKLDPELAGEASDAFASALSADAGGRMNSVAEFADEVLPSLGNPERGAESLRSLVDQSEEDETLSHEDWAVEHLPFIDRFPWAEPLFERSLAAAAVFFAARPLAGLILDGDSNALIATLVAAAVTALWPPIGSALVAVAFAVAITTVEAGVVSLALAVLTTLAFFIWWVGAGRHDHLATPALLGPLCLSFPLGGAQLSAYALHPGSAFATGTGGCLFYLLVNCAKDAFFLPEETARALMQILLAPNTWVLALGCGAAAALCAFITERGSVAAGIIGQIVCAALLVLVHVVAARVENEGIWSEPPAELMAFTLTLCVLLCVATALRGPLIWDREGE